MTRRAAVASRFRRSSTAVAATALALFGLGAPQAVADTAPPTGTPATVSADSLPTWQINGVVWSQAVVNNVVYATGSFTKARPPGVAAGGAGEVDALNVFAYDITTGNRVASFSHSLNGQGRVVTASADGSKIYVGGDFTAVDGVARGHVAAFNTATGALDPTFKANVSSEVRALATTGTTLYIGGTYGSVNGTARKNLSAVSTSTGSLLPWAPKADNGTVWAMVLSPDRSRVIVGGSFTTLSGQSAYGMGALDASSGANLPWAANQKIRDAGSSGAITSLRTDGQKIYGSGYSFGSGTNFEGTFAADPNTGNITVVNDCHGDTYDVLPVGPVLYSVGHAHDCSWIRSFPDTNPRVRWQRALAQTIAPTTTNIGPDNYGWNYNGLPASSVLQWFPKVSAGSYTGQSQGAWSLAGNSTYLALGGEFPKVNGGAQQGLARMAVSASAPNKQGPTYTTNPDRPIPATTATRSAPGTVSITFGTAWDYDNETLTYDVFRDGSTVIRSLQVKTNFWTLPNQTVTDTGLAGGSTHTYQVRIKDPFGNVLWSPKSSSVAA
jgi:hypothetical protein